MTWCPLFLYSINYFIAKIEKMYGTLIPITFSPLNRPERDNDKIATSFVSRSFSKVV